jgi:hypothetical protein
MENLTLKDPDGNCVTTELKQGDIVQISGSGSAVERDEDFAPANYIRFVTAGAVTLIKTFWEGATKNKDKVKELCVSGASGSGKSCAAQLLAGDIARKKPKANVIYIRDWDPSLLPDVSRAAKTSARSETETFLIVDQLIIDKEATTLGALADNVNLWVILLASANLPHFSEDREGGQHQKQEYDYPFSSPLADCKQLVTLLTEKEQSELVFEPSLPLDFKLAIEMAFPDGKEKMKLNEICSWTNGHLLSISQLSSESKTSKALKELLAAKANRMTKFFKKNIPFYLRLVSMFKKQETKLDVRDLTFDRRYMGKTGQVLSPLFLQAFEQSILLGPSLPNFFALSNTQLQTQTASENGFGVEREVLQTTKLIVAATACLKTLNIQSPTEIFSRIGYRDFKQVASEAKAALDIKVQDNWAVHCIPLAWNERSVDGLLLYFVNSILYVIGDSISLSSAQDHAKSLAWVNQLQPMKTELEAKTFSNIRFVLLFTGKQTDGSVNLRVAKEYFDIAKDRTDFTVMDFPVVQVMEDHSKAFFKLDETMKDYGARVLELVEVKKRKRGCCNCSNGTCATCQCGKSDKNCGITCPSSNCQNKLGSPAS